VQRGVAPHNDGTSALVELECEQLVRLDGESAVLFPCARESAEIVSTLYAIRRCDGGKVAPRCFMCTKEVQ
jgi:hypothetical protein